MSIDQLPKSVLGGILAIAGPIDFIVELQLVCKKWRETLSDAPLYVLFTQVSLQGTRKNSLLPGRVRDQRLQQFPFWRSFGKHRIALLDLRDVELEANLLADILSNLPALQVLNVTNTHLSLGQVWSILNYKLSEREAMQGTVMDLRQLRATNNRSVNLSIETMTKVFPRLTHLYFGNTEFSASDMLHVLRALECLEVLDITYTVIDWTRLEAEEVGLVLSESPLHTFLVHEMPPSLENVFLGLQITVIKDTVPQAALDCSSEEELDRVERLIERGADPNVNCSKSHPAYTDIGSYAALKVLHRVTEESLGLQLFQIMCRGGLDLSYHQQEEPFTLLHGCIERAFVSLTSLFLRCGADMIPALSSSLLELPAICKAAVQGEDGVIQAFIDLDLHNHPVPKNFCDLICSAIQSRKESVLELVLEHGVKMRRCKNHPNFLLKNPEILDSILKSEYREMINISPDMIYEAMQYHAFQGAELVVQSMVESTMELLDLCANEEMILAERQPNPSRTIAGAYNFHKPVLLIAVV